MSNTTHTTMKTKNKYSVGVILKDKNKIDHSVAIEVEAWGIGWITHEVEESLKVNIPFDAEIIRIEKLQ